jgi:hypothetical protein
MARACFGLMSGRILNQIFNKRSNGFVSWKIHERSAKIQICLVLAVNVFSCSLVFPFARFIPSSKPSQVPHSNPHCFLNVTCLHPWYPAAANKTKVTPNAK